MEETLYSLALDGRGQTLNPLPQGEGKVFRSDRSDILTIEVCFFMDNLILFQRVEICH